MLTAGRMKLLRRGSISSTMPCAPEPEKRTQSPTSGDIRSLRKRPRGAALRECAVPAVYIVKSAERLDDASTLHAQSPDSEDSVVGSGSVGAVGRRFRRGLRRLGAVRDLERHDRVLGNLGICRLALPHDAVLLVRVAVDALDLIFQAVFRQQIDGVADAQAGDGGTVTLPLPLLT